MSEHNECFVSRGVMDESFIRAANKQIMNAPFSKVTAIICGSMIALSIIAMLVMGFFSGMWDIVLEGISRSAVILLALMAFLLLMKLISRWSVNQSIKRIAEENPGCRVEYEVGFAEDGVHLHHLTNGGNVTFAYSSLKRLMPVQGEWALLTKTNAYFPVFSSKFSRTDQKSLLVLLKEKNPKLKIDFKE